jgi:hypothetical protein
MNTEAEDRAELRKIVKGINVSREILDLLKRVEDSDITKIINAIDGNFRDSKNVELVFANEGKPGDSRYNLIAILDGFMMGEPFVQLVRRRTPTVTVRVLTLCEGNFQGYVQYNSVNEVEKPS